MIAANTQPKNHLLDVFKETGINIEKNGIWQLVNPSENKYQFAKVWQGIDGFLKNSACPQKLTNLY